MAELTADDHLTVDGDANIVVSADHEHALLGTAHCWGSHTSRRRLGRLASLECYTMLETAAPSVDATQSAAVKHSSDAKPNCDPPEHRVLPASTTNIARLPSRLRRRGSRACPARHGARRSSPVAPGAEACRATEANLGAISPGWGRAGMDTRVTC